MVKIKEIPINDRPMERLIRNGVETLSDEELLAIIFKTGTKGNSAKELTIIFPILFTFSPSVTLYFS